MSVTDKNTAIVKQTAAQLGFDYCGIAKAGYLSDDARRLESWLSKGMHGTMQYMQNHFDLRVDPTLIVPGAKSIISILYNYYPAEQQVDGAPKISKYAYGKDYHEIIRKKLNEFLSLLQQQIGDIQGRGFVDSAPVLERSWAQKSGLGWVGKNGNLIHKAQGSFFFIASLIVDLPLTYDDPFAKDYCGSCTRCIDACPTEAILPDKVINAQKCISYYTIELKEELIPEKNKWDDWIFGCDVCQDVCPWNRFSKQTRHAALKPITEIINFNKQDWDELTEEKFKLIFSKSALKRTKYAGIKRNLKFIQK